MPDQVLWRRLRESDFNAMHGLASPKGQGGGARHIVLGVSTSHFPITTFLRAPGQKSVLIKTRGFPGLYGESSLSFAGDPHRRGGEWIIRDQRNNRHPAWSVNAGFPKFYDALDPPYILIFRINNNYDVRFAQNRLLKKIRHGLPAELFTEDKGVGTCDPELLLPLKLSGSLFSAFALQASESSPEPFDPKSLEDGRKKIFSSIFLRQGQGKFRKSLLKAYSSRCAITETSFEPVLEAAHIVPYLGPKTNGVSNGLLLRADIHTLFDLGLITVRPSDRKILVSGRLKETEYQSLRKLHLREPSNPILRPADVSLEAHFGTFRP